MKKIVQTCNRPDRCNYLSNLLVNTVRFVIFMVRIPRPGFLQSYADMLIQLAECKFYTAGPLHTAMSAILYWYALVRSKRPVGEKLHSQRGIKANPGNRSLNRFKIRMVPKSEPEIGPVHKRTIPFPFAQKKAGPV